MTIYINLQITAIFTGYELEKYSFILFRSIDSNKE